MLIKELDSKTFDTFSINSYRSHFEQSSSWANVSKSRGYIPHLLGFYDNDDLKAIALLLEKKILNYSTFFCPRGPVVDYSDLDLLKEIIDSLKDYSKKHNGLYIKFDPDLLIHKLDDNANPVDTFEDNFKLLDYFKSLGLKHRGFTIKFNESSNPRFTFRVDVNKNDEVLLNSFHKTTYKILKRNNPFKLNIYKGDIEDVKNFYSAMKETAKRKHMYLESEGYFLNFYKYLHDDNRSDIYIVKANIKTVKEIYKNKLNEVEKEYEENKKYSYKKQQSLKIDLDCVKAKLLKEVELINQINEDEIILSSIITAKFKDKVWTIHGGNSDELMFLYGNYELYYYILKDARDSGYHYVDFYGSEGKVDKTSPEYGIYLFKLRFGGDFDEFIGEFSIITKPLMNFVISKALHIRRRLLIKKSIMNN